MSTHIATIEWSRETSDFAYETYNREHLWRFDGGTAIDATAAPQFRGREDRVDPEEALVAIISSCHMLTFLAIASRQGHIVDHYRDEAIGTMEKNERGKLAVTRVQLRPRIVFGGEPPAAAVIEKLHRDAHEHCFIANSVRCAIEVALA